MPVCRSAGPARRRSAHVFARVLPLLMRCLRQPPKINVRQSVRPSVRPSGLSGLDMSKYDASQHVRQAGAAPPREMFADIAEQLR